MGKTSRWFRAFLGSKKSPPEHSSTPARPNKNSNANDRTRISGAYAASESEAIDANKHAIAVAAATAAVAEAALAAAQAAAEVVRLTSGGGGRQSSPSAYDRRRESAAVKIQSAFRAYLARRALRALKGLVRLQALVRGHIVRKQSADMLRRMQALARIQARACANRAHMSESSRSISKSSKPRNPGLANPKKYDNQLRAYSTKSDQSLILKMQRSESKSKIKETVDVERIPLGSNWLDRWMAECSWNTQGNSSLKTGHADDERSDKILEVDTWKPHLNSKQSDRIIGTPQHFTTRNYNDRGITTFNFLSRHSTKSQKQNPNISSGEVSSLRSLKFPLEVDQAAVWTSDNSPQMYSATSRPGSSGRRGPFTPARSECSRSLFGDYLGCPSYMANTESSLAKFRSQSAPRQRMQVHEKLGSTKRYVHGFLDADTISERGLGLDANFKTKGYSGSSQLDRIGMPVQGNRAGGYNYSSYGGKC